MKIYATKCVFEKSFETSVSGLFPSVVNLASWAEITANATCGMAGAVKYCKLVEHVDRRTRATREQCSVSKAKLRLSMIGVVLQQRKQISFEHSLSNLHDLSSKYQLTATIPSRFHCQHLRLRAHTCLQHRYLPFLD